MSGLLRPKFSEGQILGAGDLTALVVYDQQGLLFHETTEHLWGVAQGLTLTTKANSDSNSTPFVDVSLSPGRAVDRLGRTMVVTESLPLDPSQFFDAIANIDTKKFYPVYVQAKDVDKPGETQPGKCGATLSTITEESLQIVFGNPGSEKGVVEAENATVDHVGDTPLLTDMVLVGWVQFDPAIFNKEGRFTAVATEANGASIRYVGVVASDVVAGGGTLTLHTRPDGQRFAVELAEDGKGGCTLKFGKQNGTNPVQAAVTIDEKGNITYTGVLDPLPPAKIQAVSGFANDGVFLPLPPGITEDNVKSGAVSLHVVLTPVPTPNVAVTLPSGAHGLPFVDTCEIDQHRQLTCIVRWVNPNHPTQDFIMLAGGCNYLIAASGA
ncbi:MAG: hypothetical protein ACM31C_31315 [Acidobacteriota bacterium]